MKNWANINPDIPALDALKQCFDERIMTGNPFGEPTFNVGYHIYDTDGVRYFGYENIHWKDVARRGYLVYWFEGLNVLDVNVVKARDEKGMFYNHPRMNWTEEETAKYEKFFEWEKRFTGSRNEVNEICGVKKHPL